MATAVSRGTASSIVADAVTGYHLLKIDGYSRTKGTPNGAALTSDQFVVGGHRWRIRYYPNGDIAMFADYISFHLMLDENATSTKGVKVKAQFQICFADQVRREILILSRRRRDPHREDDGDRHRNLRHRASASDLNQKLGKLLDTEKGADVVFGVGGETFAAHRCVLAAQSPVFSAELFGPMKDSDRAGVVRIDDMEAQVFKALLRFMYTDSLPEMEEEEDTMCQHLLVAADRYNLERLKLICEDRLCKHVGVGTVVNILTLAGQHHCDGLKKACLHFLGSPANLSAVLAGDGFEQLSRSCPSLVNELVAMLAPPIPPSSHA
uniref:BTB/POZ domain containing protein n=1 Tax=Oryza sativa subsp. japonica TaxID=39947 RepID=Q7XED3_ORYSJ|nr:BTB/POZ domain containing protein [Oryza sativa Japonica Group]